MANVGKYSIHGAYGIRIQFPPKQKLSTSTKAPYMRNRVAFGKSMKHLHLWHLGKRVTVFLSLRILPPLPISPRIDGRSPSHPQVIGLDPGRIPDS